VISFRLLGHVSIDSGGHLAYANGSKMWTVAAMLALEPNRTISMERLIDEVWPHKPPASAVANIRTYISYLRRILGPAGGRLTGHGVGYRLELAPHEHDVGEFERLIAGGRAAAGRQEPAACAAMLTQALALFSGPVLLGVRPGSALAGVVGLLEEERLGAVEELHAAELAIGRHADLVGSLRRHVATFPLRERGWAQLMTALYRCGDAAGALAAYGQARTMLVSQLGIEPGPHLRQLQHAILLRSPELDIPSAATAPAARPERADGIPRSGGILFGRDAAMRTIAAWIRQRTDESLVIGVHGPPGAGVSALVGAVGRVLPMSPVPLDLIADADRFDPEDPDRTRQIRGQSSIAATPGRVRTVQLLPPGAPACASAVDAVRDADWVVLGPGSWFTSVIPHLLLRELGVALATTRATVVVTLNLVPQPGETEDYSPVDLLQLLADHAQAVGGLWLDAVVADVDAVGDVKEIEAYTREIGARLLLSKLVADESRERHDPVRLADSYRTALGTRAEGRQGDDVWR